MTTSFYTEQELKDLGLKSFGHNVLLSRKASIYGAENISIGHDVRIDDFCILSGKITLGSYIHISAYTALYAGSEEITIGNFSSISSRCVVYALTDDYSGQVLLNSMVPDEYKHVISEKVIIDDYVNIGTGCTVFPGVHIAEGCAVWAMSMVSKSLKEWECISEYRARELSTGTEKCASLGKNSSAKIRPPQAGSDV